MTRETSIAVYHEIVNSGLVGERQAQVYEYLLNNPNSTDMEITKGLNYDDPNKVRPRRKDLLDLGIIEDTGKRECSITGKTVHQWNVNEGLQINQILCKKKGTCPTTNTTLI